MLDLEFFPTGAGGFVPVYLSASGGTILKPHLGNALALPPPALSISPAKPLDFTDGIAGCEGLRAFDFADNLEFHGLSEQQPNI